MELQKKERIRIQLVDVIKKFPVIYCTNWHTNRLQEEIERAQAWEEISNEMNLSVESCKGRWKFLLHIYTTSRNMSADLIEKMSFLNNKNVDQNHHAIITESRTISSTIVRNIPSRKRKREFRSDRREQLEEESPTKRLHFEKDSQYYEFLRYIYLSSCDFPTTLKNDIKRKVFNILCEAERKLSRERIMM